MLQITFEELQAAPFARWCLFVVNSGQKKIMSGSMPESTSESMRHEERDTNEAGALPSNKRNRRFRDDANNRGTTKRRKDMGRNEWRYLELMGSWSDKTN